MIKNERIFITGGAGYLGKNIIKRLYTDNEITVYSRDEAKHYYLKKQFPKVNFVVGDVRNFDLMDRAVKKYSCTVGIFAASLKQIEACEENFEEANKVIVEGAFNSRRVAEENGFKSACFISSDKSRAATTIYGAMKYVAGESFIVNSERSYTNLTTAIYGNVMNSTGSIIPLIWDSLSKNRKLLLYNEEMTRFLLTIEDAVDLIEKSVAYKACNVIPQAKSFLIKDLFEIFHERFGLEYEVTKARAGEKIHEIMASSEEIRRMEYVEHDNIYLMYPRKELGSVNFTNNEYSSREFVLTKPELIEFLEKNDFYKS